MSDLIDEVYKAFKEAARCALDNELDIRTPGSDAFPYQFGSPIEEILFWAFAENCQSRFDNVTLHCGFSAKQSLPDDGVWPDLSGYSNQIGHRDYLNPDDYHVFTQCSIGRYRADFLIEKRDSPSLKPIRVVVECDGHDFHERTKAQAAHDRSRDRYMQTRGLPVLRFTGSEIHADPFKCAAQIYEFFEAEHAARVKDRR